MKFHRRSHALVLTVVWASVHAFLFWHYGMRDLYDARAYVEGADFLLANGRLDDLHLFYAVPIGLLAIFRLCFPGDIILFILFQGLVSGLAVVALYKSSAKLFDDARAGLVAGLIFLLWWDNIHWNTVTMTESLARSSICFMIYCLVHFKGTASDFLKVSLLSVVIFFIRPAGIITIVSVFVFGMSYYKSALKQKLVVTVSVGALLAWASIWAADRMFSHWDFTGQYVRGNVITYADLMEQRNVYYEYTRVDVTSQDFDTTQAPSIKKMVSFVYANPGSFVVAAALKVGYLVSGVRPYYSLTHNIFSIGWLLAMYLLCYWGWKTLGNEPIKLFTLTSCLLNCLLVGISTVDWDNRFFIPMEPGLILLAGGGLATLMNRKIGKVFAPHLGR